MEQATFREEGGLALLAVLSSHLRHDSNVLHDLAQSSSLSVIQAVATGIWSRGISQ